MKPLKNTEKARMHTVNDQCFSCIFRINPWLIIFTALSVFAMEQAIAQNTISGTVTNRAENTQFRSDVLAINKETGDTTKTRTSLINGGFSIDLPDGNYKLEALANFHYIYRDTNFVVDDDKTLDIRMIRGKNEDSSNFLICPVPAYSGSFLKWAGIMFDKDEFGLTHDVVHWPSERRRLYVSGVTGLSRLNLDTVLATIGAAKNIYYDEQLTDSTIGTKIYGVGAGHDSLDGGTAQTWFDSLHIIQEEPRIAEVARIKIYVTNDQGPTSKRTFSRELLRNELEQSYSLWPSHVMVGPVVSTATIASEDEINLANVNQGLLTGEDWRKYVDTIGSIVYTGGLAIVLNNGWNMVSVPTAEPNMTANAVFSEKQGSAFKYQGGYTAEETLKTGKGYWIKLPNTIEKEFSGTKVELDTIAVDNRWNIIGGIGYPVPKDSIEQIPPGILVSNFFKYGPGGYAVSDTIYPGKAYWVKSNGTGQIILKKPE